MSRRWARELLRRGFACAACAAVVALFAACIIAEPPSDLPELPRFRPTILRGSVVPSTSGVLGAFPDRFIVPVELVDPNVTLSYRVYIDYNPITGDGLDFPGTIGAGGTPSRVRVIDFKATAPPDLTRCHVIEFVVAESFFAELEGKGAHAPREPGGDSVTWFYSPGGDLSGCPVVDAGVLPSSDAGGDADAGGS